MARSRSACEGVNLRQQFENVSLPAALIQWRLFINFFKKPMAVTSFNKQYPWKAMIIVFIAVSSLWTIGAAINAFLSPDAYVSTVRIDFGAAANSNSINTEVKMILSQRVLTKVITKLQLREKWGHRYFGDEQLKPEEILKYLSARLRVFPIQDTHIISISSYSEKPDETAEIANAIADSYRDAKLETQESTVAGVTAATLPEILDIAQPPLRPFKPNRPVYIALGLVVGIFFGLVAAGLVAICYPYVKAIFMNPKNSMERRDSFQPAIKQKY
jgi:capsular polysaccharide biosynthesis protein